jgi:hypothetical protein
MVMSCVGPRCRTDCRRACWGTVIACWVSLLTIGCGYQTYEQRLAESQKYFHYLQRIDSNLAAGVKDEVFEEIRVPRQFVMVKKPVPFKNEAGEMVLPEIDPRQPDYAPLVLPGLVATWESGFDVVVDGQRTKRKGYIYALSNGSAFGSEDANAAADFTRNLLSTIAEKLNLPALDAGSDGVRETFPRSPMYTVPNDYYTYRFQADQLRIDGAPYTVELYVNQQKEIQAVLLMVLPVGIDASANLSERMNLMLEKLKVSDKRPPRPVRRPPTGGSPGIVTPAPPPGPAAGF